MPARVMRNQGTAAPQGPPPQTGYMNPPPPSSSGHEGMHMQQQQQHYPQGNNNNSSSNNTNGNNNSGMGSSAAGGGGGGVGNNNNGNNGGGNAYNDQRMPSSYNHAYGMGSASTAGGGGAGSNNNNNTTNNNNQSAPMHTPNPPPPPPGNMGMGGPQNLPPPPNVYQQGGNHNNNSNAGGAMGSGMNVGAMPYNAGNMLPPPPQGGWGQNNAGGGNMMYGGGMGMQNEYNNNNNSGGSGNGSGEYGMGGAGPHMGAGGGGANYMPPPPPQGQGYGGPQQQGQSLNNSRRMRTPCPPPSPNMSLPPPPLQPPPLTQGPPPPPPPQPSYYNPNVPPTPSSMSGYNTGGNNNNNNNAGMGGGGGGNYGNNNNNNGGGGNHYRVNTNAGSLMHGDSASSYGGPPPPSMQPQVLQPGYLREDSSTYGPGGTELTNSPPSQPQSQPSPSRGGNYGNYGPLPPPPHMQQLAPSQPAMMNRGYDNGGSNYGGMMNSGGGNNNNNKSNNNNMGGNMNMNANYMGGYGGNSEMRGGQNMYGGPHHGNPNVMAPPSANLSPGGRMHPAAPNNRVSSPGMMSSGTGAGMMSPQPQSAPPVGPPNNSNSNSMIMGGHNAGGMDWAGGATAGPQGQPQMQPMYNNNNNNNNVGGGNGTHMNSPSSNMGGGNGNAMMPPPPHHPQQQQQQQQPPPPPPPQSPSGNMMMANRSGMRGNNTHHHGGNNNMGGQYKSNSTHGMMSGAPNALMPPNMQLPLISPTQQPPPPPPQAQPPQPLMGGGPQGMLHQGPPLPQQQQQQQGGPSMHYGAGYGGNNNNSTAPSPQHYMNNANSNMHHPAGGQGHMNHYGNANLSSGAAAVGGGGNGSVMNSMPNSVSNSMYMDPTLALPPPQMQMNNGTLNMSIPDTPIYDEGTPETVTTFYEFLKERGLLRTGTLHDFLPESYDFGSDGPLKIGIDANYTMNSLRARLQEYDPLWFLHSWLPDQLLMLVRESVLDMRRRNLEPVWVFNGIGVSSDVETLLPSGEELIARNEVWRKLTDGELPARKEIEDAFDTSLSISEDVLMAVQRFLRSELNVLAVTAPFLNWCQLATFHKEGDVQLLMAAPEMLIVPYEPMRLIVEIDLASEKVAYFDRDEVLRELFPHQVRGDDTRAAGDRLLDFGLLTATHPAITAARAATTLTLEKAYEELVLAQQRFGTMRELITFYGMGEGLDRTRQGSEPLKHAKGRTYIQYSAVFSKSFKDCPLVYFRRVLDPSLTNAHMPHNLSGVFGDLVPLALFYFQFVGLLSVSLMTILTQSYFRDEFPISDSEDYHYHLPVLGALRGQIVYQIVLKIKNIVYRAHLDRISWVRWFDSILASVVQPKDTIILDEWYLHHLPVLDRFTDYNLDRITIATVLAVNATTCCVPPAELMANDTGRQAPILYHGKKETYMAVLMKVFDFLGYFTHPVPPKKELGNFLAASSSNNNNNSNANSSHNAAAQQVNDGYGGGPSAELVDNAGNEMYANNNNSGMEMMMPQSSQHSLPRDDSELHEEKNFTHYLARSLECCPESFQTALVRLTELARVQIINAAPCHYVRVNTPGMAYMPSRNDADEAPEVLLATRVACLVSLPYRSCEDGEEFEWAPVYSRHLCAFSVMVRAMNRNLHELVEAVTASVFLSGYSDCELRDFTDLIPLLPFGDLPSSIGGLLLHYVLVFPADYEKNCNTPEERCEYLQCKFKSIPDVTRQLRTVMEFTFHALFLINAYIVHVPIVARAPSLNQTTVVTDTLNLLHEKWRLHLDGPAPEDVHELWRPEV